MPVTLGGVNVTTISIGGTTITKETLGGVQVYPSATKKWVTDPSTYGAVQPQFTPNKLSIYVSALQDPAVYFENNGYSASMFNVGDFGYIYANSGPPLNIIFYRYAQVQEL